MGEKQSQDIINMRTIFKEYTTDKKGIAWKVTKAVETEVQGNRIQEYLRKHQVQFYTK